MTTQVLALDSYHGGSHRAFLEGWTRHSRHDFTILSLPPYKWKWRMRHGAITFADLVDRRVRDGSRWQVLVCTDMLNLAEFRGLCRPEVGRLPAIAYFHENQLTYPRRQDDPRDLHFAFTNLTTALAADCVWFNSAFHRDSFLTAIDALVRRMPDYRPLDAPAKIRAKASVRSPGIEPAIGVESRPRRPAGPLRLLWVARWEHDKNPELFFQALTQLLQSGCDFRVSVLGESFDDAPACFAEARREWAERIDRWGYLPDRQQYWEALKHADVVVSTADHEFFGIAVVEAVAAGCYPVLPNRLAYPELFGVESGCLYDGTLPGLVRRLKELSALLPGGELSLMAEQQAAAMARFHWPSVARQLDAAVDVVKLRSS